MCEGMEKKERGEGCDEIGRRRDKGRNGLQDQIWTND